MTLVKRIGYDDYVADMDNPNPEFWEPVDAVTPEPEPTEAAPAAEPESE